MPVAVKMTSHLEEQLQRDIDRICEKVREMSGLVERALKDSLKAFLECNRQQAYIVILRDQRIDELENEIDRLCLEFLVRQQPVAAHLRFVYVTMKINQELERIGDYSESVARQALKVSGLELEFLHDRFQRIASLASSMLHDAIEAFLHRSPDCASKTIQTELLVDDLRNHIDAELIEHRQKGRISLESLPVLMAISRRFERVADQSKNICDEVIYMCTGEQTRHLGGDVFRVLFVDDSNSCLSQMAEAIGNSLGEPKFLFSSAGIQLGEIDRRMVQFFMGNGLDLSRAVPKTITQIPNLEHYQIMVLLGSHLQQSIPKTAGKTVFFEWDIPDPAKAQPADNTRYEETCVSLKTHISDLIAAVFDTVPNARNQSK